MTDLERLFAIVDEQLGVLAHRTLIDAEDAELADKRVVGDLEHVGNHVPGRIGDCNDRFGIGAFALDEGWRITFERIWQQALDQLQQLRHAGAAAGRDETDRHEVALAQALLEGIVQLASLERPLAFIEIAVHDLLVDLDDLIEDLLMGFGDRGEIGFSLRFEEAVDDLARAIGRQVDRQAFRAEFLAQFCGQGSQIAFGIDAVDDEYAGEAALAGVVHQSSRTVFDAVAGIDDDDAGLDRGQGRQGRAAEIRVARRVDQIDVAIAVIDRDQRRLHRVTALFLHRIKIGNGVAAFDRTCRLDRAAGMQQGFKQGGFAGAGMACQGDVADGIGAVRHDLSPMGGVANVTAVLATIAQPEGSMDRVFHAKPCAIGRSGQVAQPQSMS